MSIDKPESKMPKPDPVTGRDTLGIKYQGPVLTGLLGLNQQLETQAASSPQTSAQIREIAPGGLNYRDSTKPPPPYQGLPTDPDPLYAAQRESLPHPSYADPVIRCHLNLPPLPDPYEQQRQRREEIRKLIESGKAKCNWGPGDPER